VLFSNETAINKNLILEIIKMPGYKKNHTAEDIKREISVILRRLKDPRVSENMISIVKIDVAGDASDTKVYISSLNGLEKAKEAAKVLKNAAGFIRKEIGSRINLKYVPTVSFHATDSIEYGVNISKALDNLKRGVNDENII
jgi:ribosome-binding factor A